MHTMKEFNNEQKEKLKKIGFKESHTPNTWYKQYGSDDEDCADDNGFALILNPLNAKGTIKINYCYEDLDDIVKSDGIIDDTCDIVNIFNDIAKLKKERLIFE